ncbi:MAG: alpha-glucuronidase [Alphaproteobacteria bacterium]|nr:alpha-glucuronidase [Alphaproteobacteria bacterium]
MATLRHIAIAFACLLGMSAPALAENGYDLWLRYKPVDAAHRAAYRAANAVWVPGTVLSSVTLEAAAAELQQGVVELLGNSVLRCCSLGDGAVVIGTPSSSRAIAGLHLDLSAAGDEGYVIRSVTLEGHKAIAIAANRDIGVLYGVFAYLRLMQTGQSLSNLDIVSAPKTKLRLLNHWDNLNRTSERGYAGLSLWNWSQLPALDKRYTDYARANASIGINGAVLNNVNADLRIFSPEYLRKVAALANVFRPYGIKVYLSVLSTAPIQLGGLKTADPLDPAVVAWWKEEADTIYRAIPDFGGFLVKANSEGLPGPQDYGRTQADGANVMARALAPHNGVVIWRAFVYSPDNREDRAKQAYKEFVPIDGKFDANVLVQIKNGPLDFQPREPFSPLFGAIPKTNAMLEVQITKEYLGFATHLAYLGPLYEETLKSDTFAKGPGSTVAKVIDGELFGNALTGMAGVANTGTDPTWSGSIFNQANWYVFGRMAWKPEISSRAVAEEWVRQTFGNDPKVVQTSVAMMMASRQAVVDYMTPLGLNLIMGHGTHYGPAPWDDIGNRPDWKAPYYHHADGAGLGFNRTATGSNALEQYAPQVAAKFADKSNLDYLLWFHHVGWNEKLSTGRSLWDELVVRYTGGVDAVKKMRAEWAGLKGKVDSERFNLTARYLAIQQAEAQWWRDACLAYFQSFAKLPYPKGYKPPAHPLAYYELLNAGKNLDPALATGLSN